MEKTANPEVGGELPLGGADAFCLEVFRLVDTRVFVHPDAGVAELSGGEDRNSDDAVVAARATQDVAGERHFGGVELGVAGHAPEDFLGVHAEEGEVDASGLDVAEDERPGPVASATGEGDRKS